MTANYRKPKNYDGSQITTRRIGDLLAHALSKLDQSYKLRPDLLIAAWPDVIGPKFSGMTEAVSFQDGVLHVKVKNSTLYSLLNQNDKPRLVILLRKRFPNMVIKTIVFRMG